MSENFADRLLAACEQKNSRLVVGLDPSYTQLPAAIKNHRAFNDETDPQAATDAIVEFCTRVLKVVAPLVPAVKINSAFFEQYFWQGVEGFWAVVQEAKAHGLIVINDAKRADIGNTSQRYATGCLAEPGEQLDGFVGPDALTVNPYMGGDSLEPFIKTAGAQNKGLFVLVRTSNAGAAAIQDQTLSDGSPLYLHVGKLVEQWGGGVVGARGYSSVGAVVGATNVAQLAALREALPKTIFLVPGLGAQGGTADDVAKAFKADGTGAIINASRSIIFAFADKKYEGQSFEAAIEAATRETNQQINAALGR